MFTGILTAMQNHGLNPGEIEASGKIVRFGVDGNNKNGWYICSVFNDSVYCTFGNWSKGLTEKYSDYGDNKNSDEIQNIKKEFERIKKEQERVKKENQTKAAIRANEIWAQAEEGGHPYLTNKGIKSHGTRTLRGKLIVPMRINKKIVSIQQIGDEKKFLFGGEIKGAAFTIPGNMDKIIICEGMSTGASIQESTGYYVVVCFNAGNLLNVSLKLKEAMPNKDYIVAADNDWYKDPNKNPGVEKATEAAKAIGAKIAIPMFRGTDHNFSDFNDLFLSEGPGSVKKQIIGEDNKLFEEVKLWCELQGGEFNFSELINHFGYKEKQQKDEVDNVLEILRKENIIQRDSVKRNLFRIVERDEKQITIKPLEVQEMLDLRLPFGLEKIVNIKQKNIIIIAGESNSGKTSICLENMLDNIYFSKQYARPVYVSSEMGEEEFSDRALSLANDIEAWNRADLIDKAGNFQDVISNNRGNKLVYIDYLEPETKAGYAGIENSIKDIRDSLDTGVAMIAIQKSRNQTLGRGGDGTLAKARLYITLTHCYKSIKGIINVAKIEKCKMIKQGYTNPEGKILFYIITKNGGTLPLSGWGHTLNLEEELKGLKIEFPEAANAGNSIVFHHETEKFLNRND